jgi:hypothetical protein
VVFQAIAGGARSALQFKGPGEYQVSGGHVEDHLLMRTVVVHLPEVPTHIYNSWKLVVLYIPDIDTSEVKSFFPLIAS